VVKKRKFYIPEILIFNSREAKLMENTEYKKNESQHERRTTHYVFTSEQQIKDFYSEFIPAKSLESLIAGINAKPFKDRDEGKKMLKLQKLKRIEWELDRYLNDHGTDYDPSQEREFRKLWS
jgi:predicted ribonuclease toxin of YeeF-YezG toxin-antitoxin module